MASTRDSIRASIRDHPWPPRGIQLGSELGSQLGIQLGMTRGHHEGRSQSWLQSWLQREIRGRSEGDQREMRTVLVSSSRSIRGRSEGDQREIRGRSEGDAHRLGFVIALDAPTAKRFTPEPDEGGHQRSLEQSEASLCHQRSLEALDQRHSEALSRTPSLRRRNQT